MYLSCTGVVGIVQWGYVANSNGGIRFGKPFHDDYLAMFTLPLASYCVRSLVLYIVHSFGVEVAVAA